VIVVRSIAPTRICCKRLWLFCRRCRSRLWRLTEFRRSARLRYHRSNFVFARQYRSSVRHQSQRDTRNALILNGAIAPSEYGDVVALLIAELFFGVSDHWHCDDSLIATGANLFVSGRENGMRFRHSNT
jgi:hypothetical protein